MADAFSRIFGSLSSERFKSELFGKEAFFLKSAATSVADLFDIDTFFGCLADCQNVRAVFGGLKQASIAPNDARQMFDVGATICATGVEKAEPRLGALVDELKSELSYTGYVSFRAYLSPVGAGFTKHYDPRVVTTIQTSGIKVWHYVPKPIEALPQGNSPIPIPESYHEHIRNYGTETFTLEPGDILCLPPGVLHWATAGEPSLALNLAFDYLFDSLSDRISDFLKKKLLCDGIGRRAIFLPVVDADQIEIQEIVGHAIRVLSALQEAPKSIFDGDQT